MLLKDKRIFIVEDNANNRAIEQMLLERQGARVAVSRWGDDAVIRLQEFAPVDVILLDLIFPGNITGYDVFTEIQKQPEFSTTPIVAVSAADMALAVPKTREHGFAGFISKPLDFNLFPQQIARILKGENVW